MARPPVVTRTLASGSRQSGLRQKVFLLTPPDDPLTVRLDQPIPNDAIDANGRPTAWVMMQRYASLSDLRKARRTTDLDDGS